MIEEIKSAFNDVKRGNSTTLHEALAIDNWQPDHLVTAARKLDTDTRWQDVPEHLLRNHVSVLSFLDDLGFRYYLPAFLVYGLTNQDQAVLDSCEFHLLNEKGKSLRQSNAASIAAKCNFSKEQSKAIARFLRWRIGADDYSPKNEAVKRWEEL